MPTVTSLSNGSPVRPSNRIACPDVDSPAFDESALDLLLACAVEHRRTEEHAAVELLREQRHLVVTEALDELHELRLAVVDLEPCGP